MPLLGLYNCILKELLSTCQIAGNADHPLQLRSSSSPVLQFHLSDSDAPTDLCDLIVTRSCSSDEADLQLPSAGFLWRSEHSPVTLRLLGAAEDFRSQGSDEHRQLIFFDFVRFAFQCIDKCQVPELRIKCDLNMVKCLLDYTQSPQLQTVRNFLTSAFVFAHLVRISGEQQINVSQSNTGDLVIQIGDDEEASFSSLDFTPKSQPDSRFEEQFRTYLRTSGSRPSLPAYICVLFNEFETCRWYLNTKGAEGQHQRLPNHDTSLIELQAASSCLTVSVTAFDRHQSMYSHTEVKIHIGEASQMSRFRDDQLLSTVIRLCQEEMDKGQQSFHVKCLAVPCRTTLKWLDLVAGVSRHGEAETSPSEVSFSNSPSTETHPSAPKKRKLQDDPQLTGYEVTSVIQILCDPSCSESLWGQNAELMDAVDDGNSDGVEMLLRRQPDLTSEMRSFASYYWRAWKLEHTSVCGVFLRFKFGLDEEQVQSAVNLSEIVCQGDTEQLRTELSQRNCNFRDWDCRTPLMWAAIGCCDPTEQHAKCAEMLLEAGADHKATDLDGNTALHLAAASGNSLVTELLLGAGADPLAVNFHGETPAIAAKQSGHSELLSILKNYKASIRM